MIDNDIEKRKKNLESIHPTFDIWFCPKTDFEIRFKN